MATTMKLIAKTTLGSSASNIEFTNIPATYDDLLVTASLRSGTFDLTVLRFNGATTGYTYRLIRGSGAAAASFTESAFLSDGIMPGYIPNDTSIFCNGEIYIPNYRGSTNKSVSATWVHEANATTAYITATAGLWSNTAAITSIRLHGFYDNLQQHSTVQLFGITKA